MVGLTKALDTPALRKWSRYRFPGQYGISGPVLACEFVVLQAAAESEPEVFGQGNLVLGERAELVI